MKEEVAIPSGGSNRKREAYFAWITSKKPNEKTPQQKLVGKNKALATNQKEERGIRFKSRISR